MRRFRAMLALVAVLALIAVACGGGGDEGTDTTAATTATTQQTTTTEGTTETTEAMEGPLTDVGVEGNTIKLGVLAALTGPIPGIGRSVLDGHATFWDRVNAEGGIDGYQIELVVEDNAYNPEQNVVVYNKIKDEVLAFSSTLGTPTTATIWEDAASQNILVAAGSLASQWARTPNVILNLASNTYFAQFANGPYWAMEIADPAVMTADTPVGIIYQADDYGADCLGGYNLAKDNLGFNHVSEQTYQATDTDFSAQMSAFQQAGVEVIFACTLPSALATMIGTNAQLGYNPVIFGSSPSYNVVLPFALGGGQVGDFDAEARGLAAFANYYNLGTPPAFESDVPGMVQLRSDLATYGRDGAGFAENVEDASVNAFFFFGYTQGMTMYEILKTAIAQGDLTRAGLIEAVNNTKDVDLGFGTGPAGYGPTVAERIPTNVDKVGRITSISKAVFGFEDASDFFEAPYLATYDWGG